LQYREDVSREGKKISFSEGAGRINIVFGPKYRPQEHTHTHTQSEQMSCDLTGVGEAPDPHTPVTAGGGQELLPRVQAYAKYGAAVTLEGLVRVGGGVRHLDGHVCTAGRQ
jgi:hypothetical protein